MVELFYKHVFTQPRVEYSKSTQLSITFASGYIAGVVCAIVSHPADSMVSQLGKASNKGKSLCCTSTCMRVAPQRMLRRVVLHALLDGR